MNNITTVVIGLFAAILLSLCGIFFTMGGVANTGSSIPPGLYWKVDKPLSTGNVVVLCPANQPVFQQARTLGIIQSGGCPDNFETLLLKIAGKRKDIVTINKDGITVNGVLLAQSKPQVLQKEGQNITSFSIDEYELKENEVVLVSEDAENPFDSRYFGPVNTDQIDSVISPIF